MVPTQAMRGAVVMAAEDTLIASSSTVNRSWRGLRIATEGDLARRPRAQVRRIAPSRSGLLSRTLRPTCPGHVATRLPVH
jgi:hypothetical protein